MLIKDRTGVALSSDYGHAWHNLNAIITLEIHLEVNACQMNKFLFMEQWLQV